MPTLIGKSLHVTWEELACKDAAKTAYPIRFITDGRVIELIVMFERIRAIWNRPITINSAFRTIKYNKSVGGSPNSQHLVGKALDLQPPDGVSVIEFYNTVKLNADELGVRGLGKYPTFIHCDIRDSIELITW